MSMLFTVQFKRKRFITKYDMKGRVVDSSEEWIEETIRDLPMATARHYVDKTGAIIISQYEDSGHEKKPLYRGRVKFDYQKDDAPAPTTRRAKAPSPAPEVATRHADYSDLVNTLMEKDE